MKKISAILYVFFIPFIINGCAFDVIHVKQIPTKLTSDYCNNLFVLEKNVNIKPSGGYSRALKKGTMWNCIGRIAQGDVYRTKDQVLTIEASNVFEAYLVVSSKKLVGFYLPVEHTFSKLDPPIELNMTESTRNQTTK